MFSEHLSLLSCSSSPSVIGGLVQSFGELCLHLIHIVLGLLGLLVVGLFLLFEVVSAVLRVCVLLVNEVGEPLVQN